MTIPLNFFKHIKSIDLRMAAVPTTPGNRALRTFLSTLPAKLPSNAAVVYGMTEMPPIKITSVPDEKTTGIEVAYSDGSKVHVVPARQPRLGFLELQRRVESPARLLYLKEQGI